MSAPRSGFTTLKQVAERAGVSMTAVSAVLNGKKSSIRISPATAELIRKAAAELHFVPNGLARSLRTSRTNNVGLVFENFGAITEGRFYVELLDGVVQELFRNRYRLTILPEVDRNQPLNSLGNGVLDGVIWCKMPQSADVIAVLRRCPIPFVALHARPTDGHVAAAYVSADNYNGAKLAVRHLAELGHRRILFVLEASEAEVPDAQARLAGFLDGCAELGLPTNESDVRVWGNRMEETGEYLRSGPPHTAIIAWNERTAGLILERARADGWVVPRDFSVVGFDSTPYSEKTLPRLTCVHQPIREMASAAVRLLLARIEGGPEGQRDLEFPMTLDVRDSTAPPPTHRTGCPTLSDEKKQ